MKRFTSFASAVAVAGLICSPAFAQNTNAKANQIDAGGGKGLVVVDISNVDVTALNNLLNNPNIQIPATVQVPINVAADICGVAVNAIASNNDNGDKTCKATAASQTLADVIAQQAQK